MVLNIKFIIINFMFMSACMKHNMMMHLWSTLLTLVTSVTMQTQSWMFKYCNHWYESYYCWISCVFLCCWQTCIFISCLRFATTSSSKALGNIYNEGGQAQSWSVIPQREKRTLYCNCNLFILLIKIHWYRTCQYKITHY
jgi:hypothetical protein